MTFQSGGVSLHLKYSGNERKAAWLRDPEWTEQANTRSPPEKPYPTRGTGVTPSTATGEARTPEKVCPSGEYTVCLQGSLYLWENSVELWPTQTTESWAGALRWSLFSKESHLNPEGLQSAPSCA